MNTQSRNNRRTVRNLAIFAVVVFASGWLGYGLDRLLNNPPSQSLGMLLWLIAPLVTALLLRAFAGDGWKDFGLRPNFKGNGFWWLVSVLIFPAVITLSMLVGSMAGALKLNANLLSGFVGTLLTGFVAVLIKNVFEEFAWRGYLAPKVYSLNMSIWLSHAIVGVIWGVWHIPFVFVLWPYLTSNMLWYFIPLLLVGTFSQSVVYGEIRLATASVLPAWVMHTMGNAIGNALLLSGFVQLDPGKELWVSPGAESVISIVLTFAIGYWLHQRRKKIEQFHDNKQ